jgi:hypothetical protein
MPFDKAERPQLERAGASLSRGSVKLAKPDDPDFDSLFDDGDGNNPLDDLSLTGDLQEDADATMSEALRAVIARKKATQERFRTATDPEFYLCVCFQSREQKEEFLRLISWDDLGDKYLNGLEIARRLNVPITVTPIAPLKIRGRVRKFEHDTL